VIVKIFKIGKSVQGASHISGNVPCQDAHRIECLADGTLVVAVADGHGSSSCVYSDRGARLAVDAFVEVIAELFEKTTDDRERLVHLFRQAGSSDLSKVICKRWRRKIRNSYKQLLGVAKRKGDEIPQYTPELFGTTLLGLVVAFDFIFAVQIGDGDMVFVDDSSVERITEPVKFLGTETFSMSNENPWQYAVSYFQRMEFIEKAPCMFMISTDGFANSFLNDDEYFISCKDYYKTILQYGDKAVQDNLEDWLCQTSKEGCGDDITLVVVGVYEDISE
jgi:serine/threonine protein phosphatase PrpC